MPIYEFTCLPCDKSHSVSCRYEEIETITCPDCARPMPRSFSFGGVAFKGSGFYTTDKGQR